MNNKSKKISLSLNGTNVLKAIAILSVLIIHILSSVKISPFVSDSNFQLIAVSLDQLARISVPIFVALSGFGLLCKYSKKISLKEFYFKRIFKIIPQYLLWSITFYLLFYFIPSWGPSSQQPNFLWQLLLGRADYHLYFVPMIFQIYLIFPVLLTLFKRWPKTILLLGFATQMIWWWFFSYQDYIVTDWKYFQGDGEQYIWMTNWIAYFILGMYLPIIWNWLNKKNYRIIFIFVLWIMSAIFAIYDSITKINDGVDPLYALKFTRYPLFLYSSIAIVLFSFLVAKYFKTKNENSILAVFGEKSYSIYLGHTLFLRIAVFLIYL